MNQDVKTRWLAALRSGDYKQGKGTLRNKKDQYCCLGVLTQLAVEDGVIAPPKLEDNDFAESEDTSALYHYDGDSAYLSSTVADWAELDIREHPGVRLPGAFGDGLPYTLAQLNDRGDSFDTIAKVIEEKL